MTEYPNETLRLTVQRQDNPPAANGFTQPSRYVARDSPRPTNRRNDPPNAAHSMPA
jgi:hypothetical protein